MDPGLRLRLIYELLSRAQERGYDIGRTKLQKLFYFLKEFGVDPGYRFGLRHYGPYSDQLASDLGILATLDAVSVEPDPARYGYHIHAKVPPSGVFPRKLAMQRPILDFVLDRFGYRDAGELEVMATIQFVKHVLESKERGGDWQESVEIVHALKPKYNIDFINTCYAQLDSIQFPQRRT